MRRRSANLPIVAVVAALLVAADCCFREPGGCFRYCRGAVSVSAGLGVQGFCCHNDGFGRQKSVLSGLHFAAERVEFRRIGNS